MHQSSENNSNIKKVKFLIVALSISVSFNIALLINFVLVAIKEEKSFLVQKEALNTMPLENSPSMSFSNVMDHYFDRTIKELNGLLSDQTLLEEGYRIRDLALACLVNFHYFNVEKALSGVLLQQRTATFEKKDTGERFELVLYPGLNDSHFSGILRFIEQEKWPLTAEGLFYEIKKSYPLPDESLKEAFYHTPHFSTIELLMKRGHLTPPKEIILKLLISSDFHYLDKFINQLLVNGELSKEYLYPFFKQLIQVGSDTAATLLVELDPQYVLKSMEDYELKKVIKALKVKTDRTLYILRELISSLRSDEIRKEAAIKLYLLYSDIFPKDIQHIDILKKLLPKKETKPSITNPEQIVHVIKEGETLWLISKRYGISIDELAQANTLSKNKPLQIGKSLIIPVRKGT
jgi:hypothetical protein